MKNYIISLVLLTAFLTAGAQTVRHPFFFGQVSTRFYPVQVSSETLKLDSIHCFQWNAPDDSLLNEVFIYTYDPAGNRTLAERDHNLSGTPEPGAREMLSRYIYGWDDAKRMILSQIKVPDEDYQMKTIYHYDASGVLTAESYSWSHDEITWDSLARRECTYFPNGQLQTEIELGTRDNLKDEYSYDEQGRIILLENFYADESFEPDWIIQSRREYEYDEAGKWIKETSYFDGGSGLHLTLATVWVYTDGRLTLIQCHYYNPDGTEYLATQEEYQYDDAGLLTDLYDNVLAGDTWNSIKHQYFEYNAANQIILFEISYRNKSDWEPSSKTEYTYNEEAYRVGERHFYYSEGWELNNADYFFYSGLPVGTGSLESGDGPLLFPNPTAGQFTLILDAPNYLQLSIYTLQGQLIRSRTIHPNDRSLNLHISDKGLFLLELTDRDGRKWVEPVIVK